MILRLPCLFTLILLSLSLSATSRADIVWETNYDQARAKSIATGKPLFVDVYTDWCGWCKKLDASVYPDARVQQLSKSFVMVRLNAEDQGAAFAKTMGVKAYPTLFFATARGQQVARRGYIDARTFVETLTQTLNLNGPLRPKRTAATRGGANTKSHRAHVAFGARRSRPQSAATVARTWKTPTELGGALKRPGYAGAFVLGDSGLVAVEVSGKKNRARGK